MIGYPFRKEKTLFMNIRWNIILGVIALALLGWYYSLNQMCIRDRPEQEYILGSDFQVRAQQKRYPPVYYQSHHIRQAFLIA